MGDLSPLRLDSLAADLEEAAAVAEVHAGVRLALTAGRILLAEVRRLTAERDDALQVLADITPAAYPVDVDGS